jgi:hypothetical protein
MPIGGANWGHSGRPAKIVAHKFAIGAAAQAMDDLEQNHGRGRLKTSLQDQATMCVAQAKEENWNYATPELAVRVKTVGIGVDGTSF